MTEAASTQAGGLALVLVTGPSGAGRTTALHALEDAGHEVIDNMPLSLTSRLLEAGIDRPLALCLDVRNRDFSVDALLRLTARLREDAAISVRLLYLDCARDVLVARFSETRRRHPLAMDEDAEIGVRRELGILDGVAAHADVVIDTSTMNVHDLKEEVRRWFGQGGDGLAVSVQSFSFKRGVPVGLDTTFDVRFLSNPHWIPELRDGTGRDAAVRAYVEADARYAEFYGRLLDMLTFLLPAYREEGRAHVAIGIGCTGGRHRSVAVTETLAAALAEAGWRVSMRHRELERGPTVPGAGNLVGSGAGEGVA